MALELEYSVVLSVHLWFFCGSLAFEHFQNVVFNITS